MSKIHALQIATESSIRSMQEQSKKLVTGKLREVAVQKIDEQTEALVSMIGDNQVDYRFFLLLDINLPYENGYEVCRKIKQVMPVPIIFVTSRDTNADELKSIQVGGIDFITKPYDTLILLEKIKRALQLSNPNNFRELVKKDCTLDLHLSILKYQEQSIELTRNEFRILYYFFMNEDKVISKEELLEKLWNDKYYIDENVLLVNMTRLKKKMKEIGIVHLVENIRGKGWKL